MSNIDTGLASIENAERLMARMKSYVGPAVLIFFLYLLGYFPGLIANYLYRKEAKRMEYLAGQRLPGTGVINFMYWFNLINIPMVVIVLVFLLIYAIIRTIVKQFVSWETAKEFLKALALIGGIAILISSALNMIGVMSWTVSPLDLSAKYSIFSIPTPDYYADILWVWRMEAIGSFAATVISGVALFFGFMKFRWPQALWTTLKNIWAEFRGSLIVPGVSSA